MKTCALPVLLSLVTILSVTDGFSGCYPLNAAFTFQGTLYFTYGWEPSMMVGYNSNGQITYTGPVSATGETRFVTAAVGVQYEDIFYLVMGQAEAGFEEFKKSSPFYPFYYSFAADHLEDNAYYQMYGLNAAFQRPNSTVVYFTGCEYVEVDVLRMKYLGKGDNSDVGLPCYIDAAWSSPDLQTGYITQGLNVWKWTLGEDKYFDAGHKLTKIKPETKPMKLSNEGGDGRIRQQWEWAGSGETKIRLKDRTILSPCFRFLTAADGLHEEDIFYVVIRQN